MCVAAAIHATVSGSSGFIHISKGDLLTRFVTFMARSCYPPSLSASCSGCHAVGIVIDLHAWHTVRCLAPAQKGTLFLTLRWKLILSS
jgi:hypothetical protein